MIVKTVLVTDKVGNVIVVGDKVAYSKYKASGVRIGTITKICEKTIKIDIVDAYSWQRKKHTYRAPEKCVKVAG